MKEKNKTLISKGFKHNISLYIKRDSVPHASPSVGKRTVHAKLLKDEALDTLCVEVFFVLVSFIEAWERLCFDFLTTVNADI